MCAIFRIGQGPKDTGAPPCDLAGIGALSAAELLPLGCLRSGGCRLWAVHLVVVSPIGWCRKYGELVRTLLAASGGGHLTQLVNLRERLPFDVGEVTWFTVDTPQSRSMLAGEQVVFADQAPPRDWRGALANARLAHAMCRRLRFDAALSTGASIAVSALPVASRAGAESYFIESAARVDGPSVSGRILAAVPGVRTFCQYRSWSGGPWAYAGSVFDSFEPGPVDAGARLDRVVVTLGSQDGYPFDRLVRRLRAVMPTDLQVLWQTGATETARLGIEGVRSMPAAQLEAAMVDADVVVSHGGVGSALSALLAGRHPVLVARRRSAGEHVDDHQLQITRALSDRGLATACTPEDLDLQVLRTAATRSVLRRVTPPPLDLGRS